MKITIDIDQLLSQGRITSAEYARLKILATENASHLFLNLLISFGVVAAVLGLLLLVPNADMTLGLGLVVAISGMVLGQIEEGGGRLALLYTIMISIGTLLASGGIIALTEASVLGHMLVTLLCSVGGVVSKRKALLVMGTLSLSATIGAMAMYGHASYGLVIRQPLLTVLVFSTLGLSMLYCSFSLSWDYERLALTVARTSFVLVNFGFWVGSLWGDDLWFWRSRQAADNDNYEDTRMYWKLGYGEVIPRLVFVVTWALGLIALGAWGARMGRGWVVNAAATFGGIHFYTQYFERFGNSPMTMLVAGVAALAACVASTKYNDKHHKDEQHQNEHENEQHKLLSQSKMC